MNIRIKNLGLCRYRGLIHCKSDSCWSSPRPQPQAHARWSVVAKASIGESPSEQIGITDGLQVGLPHLESRLPSSNPPARGHASTMLSEGTLMGRRHHPGDGLQEVNPTRDDVPAKPAAPPGHGSAAARKSSKTPYRDSRALDAEILSIGLPMLATLAADPIAGLVDSAYMGRAGSAQLAAVGVALSIFNTATKLFNVPLLAVTTSAVAKATGEARRAAEAAAAAAATIAPAAAASGTAPTAAVAVVMDNPDATATAGDPNVHAGAATAAAADDQFGDHVTVGGPSTALPAGTPAAATTTVTTAAAAALATATATAAAAVSAAAAVEAAEETIVAASSAQARAASACIWLAVLVGLLQAALLLGVGPRLVAVWGVAASSPVASPTLGFLAVRAVGAPVTILMLTLQGVFRGLQDTRTPFQATLVSNAINIALAPMLIFGAGLGAVGAAIATVTAQAIPLVLMARELRRRLVVPRTQLQPPPLQQQQQQQSPPQRKGAARRREDGGAPPAAAKDAIAVVGSSGGASGGGLAGGGWGWSQVVDVLPLFKPTGLLVLRSASVTATYALATALVAKGGTAVTAGHQICFQLWLACSLLADALAVAAQSLMARDLGSGSAVGARLVAARVSNLSLGLGLALAMGLSAGGRLLPGVFTKDPEVIRLVTGLFPIIAATQPITVLAMAWDGILYGAGGFRYAAISMALAALPAMALMQLGGGLVQWIAAVLGAAGGATERMAAAAAASAGVPAAAHLTNDEQLWLVWAGLAVLMLLRWLTIAVPYAVQIGPFRQLRGES